MGSCLDTIREMSDMSRRSFMKAGAAVTTLVASSGLSACATASESAGNAVVEDEGEWVSAACWHNCGGRCLNKVLVRNGIAIRQKTDDTHPDSPDYPQQRGCLRGRSQRKQVFAADRLKYPMKRKHWSPEEPHGELRGMDEWERISWDEALSYVADGLKQAKERYGNRSILLSGGAASSHTQVARPLGLFGGYTEYWNTNSFGSWTIGPRLCGLHAGVWDQTVNDRYDLRNCQTIVMLSMNPAWSAMGSSTWGYWQAKANGARFICIDPFYNDTYSLLGAEWIPVRPGTDTALLIAVAYAMLQLDERESLIDWDFLDRCTIGFDADHMPEGENQQDNFKDYVLGTYDGVPKSPEWAANICGVSVDQIEMLARAMTKQDKVAFLCGMASARGNNVDNLPQMIMALGAMGGHMGKSGHMTGSTMHVTSGNGGPALIKQGKNGLSPIPNPVDDSINAGEVWDAVLNGSYTWTGAGCMIDSTQFHEGQRRDIDIHVIYSPEGANLQTSDGMVKGIEAFRKVDMAVAHAQFLTTNARYSDIVLPVTTEWETDGGFLGGGLVHSSSREMMVAYSKVVEPLYEAKTDAWIATELGKKLGFTAEEVYPISGSQMYFNALSTMQVVNEDGKTYGPAVTITQEDIDEMGVEGRPQEGKMTYKELKEKGVYQVERRQGDNYGYIALKDFVDDPEGHPLSTKSGKLEIYCKALADTVNGMGFSTIKPIPTYNVPEYGYEATFRDFGSGEKGEFPFQLINPHYLRRAHSVFDNVPWLREAWENPVFINADDAAALSVKDGDTVLVTSPFGKTLRPASVTNLLRPGVVGLPHGAWVDVDEETGIDKAGADNYLSGQVPTGQGVSGFNSNICKIEKYDSVALVPDAELPLRMALKEGE